MSRAEMRRAARETAKQGVVYQLTAAQIEEIRQEACQKAQADAERQLKELRGQMKNEAVEWSLKFFLAIPCLVLSDKFDFEQEKLDLFMTYVRSWLEACQQDDEALSEAVHAAQEMGYEIEWR